jgi:hypothetical protein
MTTERTDEAARRARMADPDLQERLERSARQRRIGHARGRLAALKIAACRYPSSHYLDDEISEAKRDLDTLLRI